MPMATPVNNQLCTWSAIILRSWRKCRCSIAAGTAATQLIRMLADSTRMTGRGGRGTHRARECGSAEIEPDEQKHARTQEIVATVGAISSGSPGQRTIARLTPSSLKLSTASRATSATAYVPNACGPSSRASKIPTPSVLNLSTAALMKLKVNARDARPSSVSLFPSGSFMTYRLGSGPMMVACSSRVSARPTPTRHATTVPPASVIGPRPCGLGTSSGAPSRLSHPSSRLPAPTRPWFFSGCSRTTPRVPDGTARCSDAGSPLHVFRGYAASMCAAMNTLRTRRWSLRTAT